MERKNSSFSEYFRCKKMKEALSTCPTLRAITNRFSQNRPHSKTVAVHSNSPPSSSPVRTIHIQTEHTTKPQHDSSEAIPINFDYSIPAPTKDQASVTHVRVSETVEKKNMNGLFDDYIERTKYKIRTASNAGRCQSDALADDKDNNEDHDMKKKDNHSEQFSNFIHLARRKIRTTSGIRRE